MFPSFSETENRMSMKFQPYPGKNVRSSIFMNDIVHFSHASRWTTGGLNHLGSLFLFKLTCMTIIQVLMLDLEIKLTLQVCTFGSILLSWVKVGLKTLPKVIRVFLHFFWFRQKRLNSWNVSFLPACSYKNQLWLIGRWRHITVHFGMLMTYSPHRESAAPDRCTGFTSPLLNKLDLSVLRRLV